MVIREALDSDLPAVLTINRMAFGQDDEAALVQDILSDASAQPALSLIALEENRPLGHVLFSQAHLSGPDGGHAVVILAPLAVVPDAQRQGIGGRLIERGLALLADAEVELVFVLGYPAYYRQHGFQPAAPCGFVAPYPIPDKDADAWMVQALRKGETAPAGGKVACCDALDKPELWRE